MAMSEQLQAVVASLRADGVLPARIGPDRFESHYEMVGLRTAWEKTRLVQDVQHHQPAALKTLPLERMNRQFITALDTYSRLRHPHLIKIKDVFVQDDCVYIVEEHADGSLLEHVNRKLYEQRVAGQTLGLPENEARWFFQQLVLAVDFCHTYGVAMRDITLDKVLLKSIGHKDRQLVKLDMPVFMRAKSAANTVVGTFEYMAPEYMALSDPFSTYSASAADMWSCGVILAAMLAGRMPFPAAQDTKSQLALMLQAPAAVKLPHGTSAECVQLVSRLLQPDPNKRFTAAEVMQDPWFMQDLPPRALEMNQRFLAAHSVKAPSTLSREEPARLPAPSVDEMSEDMAADPEDAGNPLAQTTLQQLQENIKLLLTDLANHSSGVVHVEHRRGKKQLNADEQELLMSLLEKSGFCLLAECEQGWLFATDKAMQQLQAQPAVDQQLPQAPPASGTPPVSSGGASSSSSAGAAGAASSGLAAASSTGPQPRVSVGDGSSSNVVQCTPCDLKGLTTELRFAEEHPLTDVGYELHPHATPGDVQLVFTSSGAVGTARVEVKLHVCLKPSTTSPGSNLVCIKVLKLHGRLDRSPALPVARRWEDIRVVRGLQFAIAVKEAGKPVNLSTPTRPPLTLHKATPPASRKLFWEGVASCLSSLTLSSRPAAGLAAPKAEPVVTPEKEYATVQLLSAAPDRVMQQPSALSALGFEVQRLVWNTVLCDKQEDLCWAGTLEPFEMIIVGDLCPSESGAQTSRQQTGTQSSAAAGTASGSALPIKLLLSAKLDVVKAAGMRHTYPAGPCWVSSIDLTSATDFKAAAEASITTTKAVGGMC